MADEKITEVVDGMLYVDGIPTCVDCNHTFHNVRCFTTSDVGRAYVQCRCKKGVREDD